MRPNDLTFIKDKVWQAYICFHRSVQEIFFNTYNLDDEQRKQDLINAMAMLEHEVR